MTRPETAQRRLDPRERRERLLAAGRRCLGLHGIDGFTLENVSLLEGTSKSLINRYFGSRDGLLDEVFQSILPPTLPVDCTPTANEAESTDRLASYIRANFDEDYFSSENFLVWLSIWREVKTNTSLRERSIETERQCFEELSQLILDVASHRKITVDPQAVANTILALMDGLWIKCSLGIRGDIDEAQDTTFRILEHHVGAIR